MMTEGEILAAQQAELMRYRENYGTWTQSELTAHSARMAELRGEMRKIWTEGATVHPFIAEHAAELGIDDPASLIWANKSSDIRFEIAVDIHGTLFRARGFDKESALRNWNEQKWFVKPDVGSM